jgi:single-strand DNA-binding protein
MAERGSLNRVMLIGNLGGDPELRYTANGTAVANLSLATNEVWTDKEGNKVERTEWHRIIVWRKLAEICNEYLSKGSKVFFEGKLRTRSWEDKDGIKRYTTEIEADNMVMLGGRRGEGSYGGPPPPSDEDVPPPAYNEEETDDDLPF